MKFLIVVPFFSDWQLAGIPFPFGLAYVSSAMKQAGFDVSCLNTNYLAGDWRAALGQIIREQEIDVLCTGGLSSAYGDVKDVLDEGRRVRPGLVTVVGGGLVSSEPEIVVDGLEANFGVIGEGEVTMVALAHALYADLPVSDIPGVIVREGPGQLHRGPARAPIEDLDTIPFPDYEAFGFEDYLARQSPCQIMLTTLFDTPRVAGIIASRSCPYQCSFCFHPLGNKYRQRSLDDIFAEIDFLVDKFAITGLLIHDELFATKTQENRVWHFCHGLRERGLPYSIALRVDAANEDLIKLLKETGCYLIRYGVESINNDVLKSMNKHITREQIERALALTYKHGIAFRANLIFGDAGETFETAMESLSWWEQHLQYQLGLAMIWSFPGTPLYKKAVTSGRIPDRLEFIRKGEFKINVTNMDDASFLAVEERMCDLTLRKGKYPGELLGFEPAGVDSQARKVFSITARCPHCSGVSTCSNIHYDASRGYANDRFKVQCRQCSQTHDLPAFKDMFRDMVLRSVPSGRLAIWGAGGRTAAVLNDRPELRAKVAFLLDSDVAKHGSMFDGIRVRHGHVNPEALKQEIDLILIVSNWEGEIFEDIKHYHDYGIDIVGLDNVNHQRALVRDFGEIFSC